MAKVNIRFGACMVEFEAKNVKDVFRAFTMYEVLGETKCGACESHEISPRFRQAQGYDFYSFNCNACRAELHLGQKREGDVLFPKRKDADGNWLPNRGWVKYEPQQQSQQQPQEHSPF